MFRKCFITGVLLKQCTYFYGSICTHAAMPACEEYGAMPVDTTVDVEEQVRERGSLNTARTSARKYVVVVVAMSFVGAVAYSSCTVNWHR